MHKFMSAVGFHDCYSKQQLDDIIKDVIASPDEEMTVKDSLGRTIFQMNKRYAGSLGVSIVGEKNKMGFMNIQYSYPFLEGHHLTKIEEVNIQKLADRDAFYGIADDYRLGMSLVFNLTNISTVISDITNQNSMDYHGIYLSSLALNGTILFGVEKNEAEVRKSNESLANRYRMIRDAKNSDEVAISKLTLEDIDLYTEVMNRALTEDILSIVDTSIMPYGVESDQYDILGYIEGVSSFNNEKTGELIYVLEVCCNDVMITVGINECDLLGVPAVGYRFKGTVWLQGIIQNEMMNI